MILETKPNSNKPESHRREVNKNYGSRKETEEKKRHKVSRQKHPHRFLSIEALFIFVLPIL